MELLAVSAGFGGGHCIGVDPYYLTHKAQAIGYHPEIILAGRRLNDSMGVYVVSQLVKAMTRLRIQVEGASVLILGLAFKENCPDIRNTRVIDIVTELREYNCLVDVHDPWVSAEESRVEYGLELVKEPQPKRYDAIVVAVAHRQFRELGVQGVRRWGRQDHVLYDLKYVFDADQADIRL
jgi:UDP-N-acetyl-D-galactosamine dehydrogenase